MTEPLSLFDVEPVYVRPDVSPRATIEERFLAFHQANGWIYDALVRLARDELRYGRRIGIGHLFEVLRWHHRRAVTTGDDFKLNNNYRSRYARLIAANEPDLADVFEMRELRAA